MIASILQATSYAAVGLVYANVLETGDTTETGHRTSAIIDDTFIYVPNLTLRMSGNSMSSLC